MRINPSDFMIIQWMSSIIIILIGSMIRNSWMVTLGVILLADFWLTAYNKK